MDNEYTRKEKECPLIGEMCNYKSKNCERCICKEEEHQIKQAKEQQK